MNELTITVIIADRSYKLTIPKEKEEAVRNASKVIDNQLNEYASSYQYKDKQDLLAMVALQYATTAVELETQISFHNHDLIDKLAEIDRIITEQL